MQKRGNVYNLHGRRIRTFCKASIGGRLRLIRTELFGEDRGDEFADRIGVPFRTWSNYENGVLIPGEILLVFLEITRVEPTWLLYATGPRYRATTTETRGSVHA
jgi:hypothetical protein